MEIRENKENGLVSFRLDDMPDDEKQKTQASGRTIQKKEQQEIINLGPKQRSLLFEIFPIWWNTACSSSAAKDVQPVMRSTPMENESIDNLFLFNSPRSEARVLISGAHQLS